MNDFPFRAKRKVKDTLSKYKDLKEETLGGMKESCHKKYESDGPMENPGSNENALRAYPFYGLRPEEYGKGLGG